jgi:glycosyltransferase involved in cell wall biosynthesis
VQWERRLALLRREIPEICAYHHGRKPKVVFGIPIGGRMQRPHIKTIESLEASIPLVVAAGFDEGLTSTRNNPYISGARAEITRKALDAKADVVFYIDADMAWEPQDLVKVLQTEGHVVAGTYRCRTDDPNEQMYMGSYFANDDGVPEVRASDGAIKAKVVPAGFLKVTTTAIDLFMRAYPELCYGPQYSLSVDLFNHGAYEGLWWGEDYAFCRNYRKCGGEVWIVPNINLDHCHEDRVYKGNFHEYLCRQKGGSHDPDEKTRGMYDPRKELVTA